MLRDDDAGSTLPPGLCGNARKPWQDNDKRAYRFPCRQLKRNKVRRLFNPTLNNYKNSTSGTCACSPNRSREQKSPQGVDCFDCTILESSDPRAAKALSKTKHEYENNGTIWICAERVSLVSLLLAFQANSSNLSNKLSSKENLKLIDYNSCVFGDSRPEAISGECPPGWK